LKTPLTTNSNPLSVAQPGTRLPKKETKREATQSKVKQRTAKDSKRKANVVNRKSDADKRATWAETA
jgi:hypothetical protein